MNDALGEVLDAVRMSGGVFLEGRFTAPWRVSISMGLKDFEPYLAHPQQIIAYHYVVRGRMLAAVEGGEPIEVRAGQAVLLVPNDKHSLGSAFSVQPRQAKTLVRPGDPDGLARMVHGGGGEPTDIVCGFLGSSEHRNPLISTLPRALKVDLANTGANDLIEASLTYALRGLRDGKVGTASVMSKLSELMFVEAVRGYAATLQPEGKGWLAGMRDEIVGRALALMHGNVNHPWTAEKLSSEVGLSRAAFNNRFATVVGVPPMRYLTAWRMQLAREKLRSGRQTIAQIAYDVGYEAEEAFTRAFKRELGSPPGAWRKATRQA